MRRTLLLLMTVAAGCYCGEWEPPTPQIVKKPTCDAPEQDRVEAWVLECIKNANPHSDEDPEDWVAQCEQTGMRMICTEKMLVRYQSERGISWNEIPCDEASDATFIERCKANGWKPAE